MSINLKNKSEIVKAYGKNEKDTGSAAVQIAMMTQKISELTAVSYTHLTLPTTERV